MVQYSLAAALLLVGLAVDVSSAAGLVSCDPCIDRSKVKIGVVHHGPPDDVYWSGMNGSIRRGASDVGIDLVFDPLQNVGLGDQDLIFEKMVAQIDRYCASGEVHGLLASLPDESVAEALKVSCAEVPVVTFNAGPDLAAENGFKFFGQNETEAGFDAGSGLAKVATTEKFCCSNHAPGVDVLADRCGGMRAGVESVGKANAFDVPVDQHVSNCTAWAAAIEENCSPDEGKGWDTIGIYLAGPANHQCGLEFLRDHPEAYATASDVSEWVYTAMVEKLNMLFAIDQQSYLQGYLPFSYLTLWVTIDQVAENTMVTTGPHRVTEPPTEHFQLCASNNFEVCDEEDGNDIPMPEPDAEKGGDTNNFIADEEDNIGGGKSEAEPETNVEGTENSGGDEDNAVGDEGGEMPDSRSLRQTTDFTHQIGLMIGGLIMALGGFLLAN
ncbi:hypothetical protein ACHAWF_011494 [Thalassiosira exigua]